MVGNQFTNSVPDLCTRPLPTITKMHGPTRETYIFAEYDYFFCLVFRGNFL
jgi:hypothetical protein